MNNIIEKISVVPDLYHGTGCTISQIRKAQEKLDLLFPQEFIDYVRKFGYISFFGTEWTGLNTSGYLNVVEATYTQINYNPYFPKHYFVIEDLGIDDIVVAVNENGQVFEIQNSIRKLLCENLSDYLDICLQRQI